MTKLEMISPVKLNLFMNKNNLTTRDVSELTCSSIRSAQRWNSETGIPIYKWELLVNKINNGGKNETI
jgi:hypothetical protein